MGKKVISMSYSSAILKVSPIFNSFGYIPKSVTARSYGSYIFNFLRNLHILSIVEAPFYIPTNCAHGFHFLLTKTYYLFFFFLITDILTDMKWYFIAVLTCISLMINNIEHLYIYLLPICMFSLEKCYLSSLPIFNWLICILRLNCRSFLYILEVNHSSDTSFASIFSHNGAQF